ncbi:piggyBac transposable element-derived protein 4-like [Mercenaria mercenaria]|uniref:piggyBac transposable element-derived protein 4-like n=1 Tax=Mercenaria mercenaria TaxID=6596 RepID=UPI00234FA003|nr:piggyBac transposable element-derived protein 4-like [Mercenaria mercenaria]
MFIIFSLQTADFRGQTGPRLPDNFDVQTASALDFFYLLFRPAMFADMARHTNNYARWKATQDQPDDKWVETNENEMKAFIGINVIMGINALPELDMYWSSNPLDGNSAIQNIMTCNRFQKLSQYFQVSDRATEPPRGSQNYDRLYKVKPVIQHVSETFLMSYDLSQQAAVDEAMIKFTGKLSFRQYMPAKPIKRGIKIWMLCDSNSAYLSKFEVYLGRNTYNGENGLGYNVVTKLTDHLRLTHRHIFFDNFFTSVPLMKQLLDNGLYACGTVRTNCVGFPAELKKPNNVKNRGEFKVLQKGDTPLTASVWKDKKHVHHLSTLSQPDETPLATRRAGADVLQLRQPHSVSAYNRFMGGVDLHDQLRMKYDVGRNSKKWWKYLFWFLLNCSIVNSFIMFKMVSRRINKRKRINHLDFRLELVRDLIGGYSKRKRSGIVLDYPGLVDVQNIHGHVNGRLPGPKRRCQYHMKQLNARRETVYGCTVCNVHLCKEGCHHRYHNQ